MDSRKFKKVENNTPKNKKRKKSLHKKNNYNINNNTYKENKRYSNKIKKYKKEELQNRTNNKHKKEKKVNYKNILIFCSILLALIVMGIFGTNLLHKSMMPEGTELIKPVGFNLTPYGYEWNNTLYGKAIVTDENGTNSSYYFTLNQMAALAEDSNNKFNYSDGLYVSYNRNNSKNIKIVDHIYSSNGKEIIKPDNFDEYEFIANARFYGRESPYCLDGFGFTEEEYKNSVF